MIAMARPTLPFAVHPVHAASSQCVSCWHSAVAPLMAAGARLAGAHTQRRRGRGRDKHAPLRMFFADACGQVLVARPGAERVLGEELREGVAILVATQDLHGTTALVVNRPTPLLIQHLDLPRYHAFGQCRLFHGGTIGASSELQTDLLSDPSAPRRRNHVTGGHNLLSQAQVSGSGDFEAHNLSPHHWVHKAEGIKGSTELGDGIFLGGSLEDASASIAVDMAKPADFKFFHRQLKFQGGEFERLFCEGMSPLRSLAAPIVQMACACSALTLGTVRRRVGRTGRPRRQTQSPLPGFRRLRVTTVAQPAPMESSTKKK